jgi:hypothetical protein
MKLLFGLLELSRTDLTHRGSLYMRRWVAEIPPLGGIRLHWILKEDVGRDFHDHPFDFASLVLRGWYDEHADFGPDRPWRLRRTAGTLAFRSAEHEHWISQVAPEGCWTLVLSGRHRRTWGFLTAGGWVDHVTYLRENNLKKHEP